MRKILLIDDADFALMLLRRILSEEGYKICGEAKNGRDGIEKYKKLKPDLVFCDIGMHEMDGMDCLKGIISVDPDANVIICSAMYGQPIIDEARAIGAKGFIEKPIFAERLIRITEEMIGKPNAKESYKKIMERCAEKEGLDGKPLLDFFEAFRKLHGFSMSSPKFDEQFLKEHGEEALIGVRALLGSKVSLEDRERLENIFRGLTR